MKEYKRLPDREIAEMAKAMSDFELKDTVKCDIELSEHLFAKGYRKQSDTVKEFAEKLRDKRVFVKIGSRWFAVVNSRDIKELVKEVCGE